MHLARFPRVRLFPTPTPLEKLENLSRHLGGPEIWIKRDDCTVVATGGNKIRKLEFLVGEAKAQGADVLIGGGSYAQSNHARIVSAAARFAGLEPVIVVRPGGGVGRFGGNALLARMLCSDLRVAAELADAPRDRLAEVEARRAIFDAIAIPTALPTPWPNGPVVASTPGVSRNSGCPGVLLCSCRKRLISDIGKS